MKYSAGFHGMNVREADKFLGFTECIKLKRWEEPSPEEKKAQREEEDRQLFASHLWRFKK